MKTLYAACLDRVGLSLRAAARFHVVSVSTVNSWSAGRRSVPKKVWAELRRREAAIIDRSEAIREAWEDAGEVRDIEAQVQDELGLFALADFVLTTDEAPALSVKVA